MTAGPLTLEDLERLERAGDNVRQHSLDPSSDCAVADRRALVAALRSVMADAEGLRDALMVAERMIESREKEANEARAELRSVMAERDALKGTVLAAGREWDRYRNARGARDPVEAADAAVVLSSVLGGRGA